MENNINSSVTTLDQTTASTKNILIIEDHEILGNYLSCIAGHYGNIDIVQNGMEALDKLSHNSYEAIVFDVRMPGMNGIEFFQEAIIRDPALRRKILFLISTDNKKHIKFMLDNQVHCIRKTLQSDEIRSALEKVLFESRSCTETLPQSA